MKSRLAFPKKPNEEVAPLAGAWVEISFAIIPKGIIIRRSPRGGVG